MFWTNSKKNSKISINKINKLILILFSIFLLLNPILSQASQDSQSSDTPQEPTPKPEATRDPDFDDVISLKLKNIEGIDKLLNETDMTYFAYYYRKVSPNSRTGAQFLKTISKKLLYLANIIMIDCDDIIPADTPMCKLDPKAADGFPRMEVYTPPEFKYNPYTRALNRHTRSLYNSGEVEVVTENMIYNFITQNIPARSMKLTAENFENFATNTEMNKVILFTDKTKTPLLFRGISNYFYERLLFGEVEKDQVALLKKFKVLQFPTLIVYQTHEDEVFLDEPKIEIFKGDVKADEIANFIGQYALREQISKKVNKETQNDPEKMRYRTNFKKLNKDDAMAYLKKFSDRKFVVYLNDKDDIAENVMKFNQQTYGFFNFVNINCKIDQETEDFCKTTFKTEEIPNLLLYKNSGKNIEKELEKKGIELPFDFSGIERQINREYSATFKEGNPTTFSVLANESKINKKVPFIYLHEGDIPLGLTLLASEDKYLKYIDFIVYEHPPKEFLNNIKITKLPQMIVLLQDTGKNDQARVLTYNEELVYFRLGNFINQYFNNERNTKINDSEEGEKLDIAFLSDNEAFKKYCIKGRKLCIIGLLDGRYNKDSQKQFENSIKILENVGQESRKKGQPASFGWVNATCQYELTGTFNTNLESLPNLVVYVPSKNFFSSLIGTFDEESITSFIDRVMQGRAPSTPVKRVQLTFNNRTCEDIKDVEEDTEDDEILREILEEEKRKRELLEKERAALEGESKKEKKKKKKKKDL